MTTASYTSDLTDIFLFEDDTNVSEVDVASNGYGVDFAMEGTNANDGTVGSKFGALGVMQYDNTTNFSTSSGDHFIVWAALSTPGLSNSGYGLAIGDELVNTNYLYNGFDDDSWNTLRPAQPPRDIGSEPFVCRELSLGSGPGGRSLHGVGSPVPSTTPSQIGGWWSIVDAVKGVNVGVDGARFGTGYDILGGTGVDPSANFAGIASDDEANSYGLFQSSDAGYIWMGRLRIGSSSSACEFEDSNVFVGVRKTNNANDNWSEIHVENASSVLDLENVTFRGLYPLERWNRGNLIMVTATATVNLNSCTFQDFGTTNLGTGATCINCKWINTAEIDANGADLSGSLIRDYEETVNASPLIWDVATDPEDYLDGVSITKGTISAHAIEFGTSSPLTMNLSNITFGGYNTSNTQTDSTFHIKRTTGNVTIYLSECTGNFSYISEGANVDLIINPVTTQVTVKDIDTGTAIESARVLLVAADATGDLNFEESVTITSSGTTATVTHTAHGLDDDEWVYIKGANEEAYNGAYEITTVNVNAYTYTMTESTTSPATGTITSTTAIFNHTTNASGIVSDSRTLTLNQNVTGRVRKSSASPYYITVPITATIDKDNGISLTVSMVPDE